jgi:hypothetical protein
VNCVLHSAARCKRNVGGAVRHANMPPPKCQRCNTTSSASLPHRVLQRSFDTILEVQSVVFLFCKSGVLFQEQAVPKLEFFTAGDFLTRSSLQTQLKLGIVQTPFHPYAESSRILKNIFCYNTVFQEFHNVQLLWRQKIVNKHPGTYTNAFSRKVKGPH